MKWGKRMEEKNKKILRYLDKWMGLREQGFTLTKYCRDRKIQSVGVYGFGRLGRHLVWELETEGFTVPWIIDKRCDKLTINNRRYKLLPPEKMESIKDADMIIVTALEDYYSIEAQLCKYTRAEVISIEQILDMM